MLKSQRYSNLVFENVLEIKDNEGDGPKRYKSLCKRAGGIFRTVGFVHFATFVEAKGKKEEYYEWLSEHLRKELNDVGLLRSTGIEDYLAGIRNLPLPAYMNVSRAVLRLLQWHKNISEILIEGDADIQGDE